MKTPLLLPHHEFPILARYQQAAKLSKGPAYVRWLENEKWFASLGRPPAPVTQLSHATGAASPAAAARDSSTSACAGGVTPGLVLSLFPGADLFGRGFEEEGYCVVRGPDKVWGGDVRSFRALPGAFEGIIGGPPCQDFSCQRRTEPTGEGVELIGHFVRIVEEARPLWFVMENVPRVPDVRVEGYTVQRIDLRASEFGLPQSRLRHIQFGSRDGRALVMPRGARAAATSRAAMASDGGRANRRGWAEFCAIQGIDPMDLPGLSIKAKYRLVGNAVPLPMARGIARAVRASGNRDSPAVRLCVCGCGRPVEGQAVYGGPACRKRMQRRRDSTSPRPSTLYGDKERRRPSRVAGRVTGPGPVTIAESQPAYVPGQLLIAGAA